MKVKILKEDKELPTPGYAKKGDAGMDIYSAENIILNPKEHKLISTGIRIALEEGYEAQIRPRSGLAAKYGIGMVNSPGTIDSGYRGIISIPIINHGNQPYEIKKGDRIAQMVFKRVERAEIEEAEELDKTERGEGGFGHTGR